MGDNLRRLHSEAGEGREIDGSTWVAFSNLKHLSGEIFAYFFATLLGVL